MAPFLKKFELSLQSLSVIRDDSIMVAISGGADSVALLLGLYHLSRSANFVLYAAHLDHGFRGEESASEAIFCRELCTALSVPLTEERINGLSLLERRRGSLQMVAREERYHFLERSARDVGADYIALGQHRDDSVETVFLRMLSGCAPAALAGIPARNGKYIRPLLPFSARELRDWLQSVGQKWVEDSSNAQANYRRNYLRNEVFPQLKTRWPSFAEAVSRLSVLAADENRYWEELFKKNGLPLCLTEDQEVSLPLERLRSLDRVVFRRYLVYLCVRFPRMPGSGFFMNAEKFLSDDGRRSWFAAGGWYLYTDRGVLTLDKVGISEGEGFECVLERGENRYPGGSFFLEELAFPPSLSRKYFQGHAKKGIFFFSRESLHGAVKIRSRKPGDRFPLTGGGRKGISDLLTDAKIPVQKRRNCTIFEDQSGIVAFFLPSKPEMVRLVPRVLVTGNGPVLRLTFCNGTAGK